MRNLESDLVFFDPGLQMLILLILETYPSQVDYESQTLLFAYVWKMKLSQSIFEKSCENWAISYQFLSFSITQLIWNELMNDHELFHNKTVKKIKQGATAKRFFGALLPFTWIFFWHMTEI